MNRMKLAAIALSLGIVTPAALAEGAPKALEEGVRAGQLKIIKEFPAPSGLTGWVVGPGAAAERGAMKPLVMFTTADGKTLITGMPVLVDESGRNLTSEYEERYIPKPDYSEAYSKLKKSVTIQTGKKSENPVFIFLDPNCVFCNYVYRAAEPYIKAGADIRWVPVAFLRPDSAGKLAAIMNAADPAAALAHHEQTYKSGGIKPVEPKPDQRAAYDANNALMSEIGASGTPAIVYKTAKGEVQFIGGMPKLGQLPGIFGLPEQPITDAELNRFR